ncbi:MAG: HAMP domain-containing protein, partial [Pyrinomonadaceae bacterium]|nr:HAMP domain-containing protein [Pyrinomonadaceae bacterium]
WYTGVLALVLVAFAVTSYFFLDHTLDQRTDNSLAEMARAFVSTLATEQREFAEGVAEFRAQSNQDASVNSVISDAVSEYRSRDYRLIVYDDAQQVVAVAPDFDGESKNSAESVKAIPPVAAANLRELIASLDVKSDATPRYATLSDGDNDYRVILQPIKSGGRIYTLVVMRALDEQEDLLEGAGGALLIAVPFALLLASVGGYFLARKSLAPVVAMSDTAARIGAENMHERLPISNERDELGRLARAFNDLLARLHNSFEQQRRFMADASHELRTPVAIVRGEAEVALSQDARSQADLRESLHIVHDEGRRLTRIVEDLFTLARADAGQNHLVLTNFYLDELVGEAARSVRTIVAERHLSLQIDAPVEMPFHGDEALMRRLVLNLLDNAIKHTPAGGQVTVKCERKEKHYLLIVTDTGSGIPAEARPHIFERFYRADRARSRASATDGARITSGAGLGLSIALWVAEAHGGTLELQRSDASGSTFVAKFPALITDNDQISEIAPV